jgi:hypothetical protein
MLQEHFLLLACPGLRERLLHGADNFVNVTPTRVNDRNAHVPGNKVGEMSCSNTDQGINAPNAEIFIFLRQG